MRLATIRTDRDRATSFEGDTAAALIEGDDALLLSYPDAGSALRAASISALERAATGESVPLAETTFAPVIPRPGKVICVGLNYADHIAEMGNEPPSFPTCFSKYPEALIGHRDDIHLPPADVSSMVDWEVELTVVIGSPVRHASAGEAQAAIAGFTVMNDISMRDWQKRTSQFLMGKTWEHATPLGPWIVDADELGDGSGLGVTCSVNGRVKQHSTTDELVFGPVDLVQYISSVVTLEPGDIIATGTPGGVGFGRNPKEFLQPSDVVDTAIEGIGTLTNRCIRL